MNTCIAAQNWIIKCTVSHKFVASYSTGNGLLWSSGKLNHVAIAVPNLEKACSLYRNILGASVSKVVVRHVPICL